MDSHREGLILKNLNLEEGWTLHWNKAPLLWSHCLLRNGEEDEAVATVDNHREGHILKYFDLEGGWTMHWSKLPLPWIHHLLGGCLQQGYNLHLGLGYTQDLKLSLGSGAYGTSRATMSSPPLTIRHEKLSLTPNYHGKTQPPTRPSFGARGWQIVLKTNFFPLSLSSIMSVYHYDVAIVPAKLPKIDSRLVSHGYCLFHICVVFASVQYTDNFFLYC